MKNGNDFQKNVEKSSHFSTKGGETVWKTVLNLKNTFLSVCGNVCFFQYESKRLCYTNDSKKHSYQSKKMRDRKVSCNMEFQRVNISGGSSFEEVAGYSRIVKADPFVFVSGTTAVTPEGTVYGEGDPYAQAKYIFTKLVKLLEENGVSKEEVVKVNIWATSSSYNMEITKAYSEFFKESRPCCTWIGIKELNRPTQLVEIEMQALIGAKL